MPNYPQIDRLFEDLRRPEADYDVSQEEELREAVRRGEANSPAVVDTTDSTYSPSLPITPQQAFDLVETRFSEEIVGKRFNANSQNPFKMITSVPGLIQQNIRILMFTIPGERLLLRDFGIGLQTFIFERNANETIQNLKQRIYSQFNKYLSYITITNLSITPSTQNENLINVSISYRAGNITGDTSFSNIPQRPTI